MRRALLVAALVALAGCGIDKAFLAGEEAAYKAITPAYVIYVEQDPDLDEVQRADRLRTVRAWRFSLDKAAKVAD